MLLWWIFRYMQKKSPILHYFAGWGSHYFAPLQSLRLLLTWVLTWIFLPFWILSYSWMRLYLRPSESFAISFHYSSLPEVLKWFITLWWPTDSTTVWMPLLLQSIGYTNQFCVNPEGTCQLVAASTERSNVDFFSTINFLHMCSNKIVVVMVTTMATMTCFMAYMLFPILEPWRLTCWWLWPSAATISIFY